MMRKIGISPKTVVLALGFSVLCIAGIVLNRAGLLSSESVGVVLLELGCWGFPVFFLCFAVGGLLQIPGILFVVAARVAFGPTLGFVVGYTGAIVAITAAFCVVRLLRDSRQESAQLPVAWAQRMLERAEARPILTIATLRLMFFLSPPLNVGLGFSSVRWHHYVAGSAIGLVVPTGLVTVATGLF